jgi:hypothetical protein
MSSIERRRLRERIRRRKARALRRAAYPCPADFAARLPEIPEAYREWAASVIWFRGQNELAPYRGTEEEWSHFRHHHVDELESDYDHLDEDLLIGYLHSIGFKTASKRTR